MGIEDITGKAQEFLKDPRVTEALKSEQAEDISDKILDGVADAAQKATGAKFTDQIQGARDAADKQVGNQ
ncbi:MAG: Rv0909 family putative TA system antitoxin [Pseudoclavibacter sp.]